MNITEILTDSHFSGRFGYTPKWLILHGTAGGTSAVAIAQYFQTVEASTHYVIGTDGQIVRCVHEGDAAYANAPAEQGCDPWWWNYSNPNFVTLSIEHCKPSLDNSDKLTDAQKQASFQLVKDICQRNNIPMRAADANGGITGHYSIEPLSRKDCPGPYPWQELWNYLGGNAMPVPQGWKDDPKSQTMTAPNGMPVRLGFRQYIINAASWEGTNYPVEIEQHVNQLELSNPALGGGQRQLFRKSMLEYTPQRNVFEGWIGVELQEAYKELSAAQATIAQLQAQIAGAKAHTQQAEVEISSD